MKKVVFRVDSGIHMGIGHVMRCLTLAEELKTDFEIFFITKDHAGFNQDIIKSKFPVYVISGGVKNILSYVEKNNYANWLGENWEIDLDKTNTILKKIGNVDMVIVDHYSLDNSYEAGLECTKVMVIDDLMNRTHQCHLLLDQNISALKEVYQGLLVRPAELLMGPKYALLRKEFREQHIAINTKFFEKKIKNILVFFGASDVNGDCLKFAESVLSTYKEQYDFTFVLNSSHRDYHALEKIISATPGAKLFSFVDNFMELMLKSDLFIGAGGTTTWERSTIGLASALISVADNQLKVCKELSKQQICLYLGSSNEMNASKWDEFFQKNVPDNSLWVNYRKRSFDLVDGQGVLKVLEKIRSIVNISIRKVMKEDSRMLYEWRNHPEVARFSLNPEPITFQDHEDWFLRKLVSAKTFIYIGLFNDVPCGSVRYDLNENMDEADISISVSPDYWGKGIATQMMFLSEEALKIESSVNIIHAVVLPENKASLRIFEKSNYRPHLNKLKKIIR